MSKQKNPAAATWWSGLSHAERRRRISALQKGAARARRREGKRALRERLSANAAAISTEAARERARKAWRTKRERAAQC